MVLGMDIADSSMVWKAVKDKFGLTLTKMNNCWRDLVPDEEIPTAAQVFQTMQNLDDIAEEEGP